MYNTSTFRCIQFNDNFSPLDLQLLIHIRCNDAMDVNYKDKWSTKELKIYNESTLKELHIYDDIQMINDINVMYELYKLVHSNTHPSSLSKIINYYVWWYNRWIDDVNNKEDYKIGYSYKPVHYDLSKYTYKDTATYDDTYASFIDIFTDNYYNQRIYMYRLLTLDSMYIDSQVAIPVANVPHHYILAYYNTIDPQLTGSIFENILSYAYKCIPCPDETIDVDNKDDKVMLNKMCCEHFKLNNSDEQYNTIDEFLNDVDINHYISPIHYIVWRAFIHYIERNDYVAHIGTCLQLLTLMIGEHKHIITSYINELSNNEHLKSILTSSKHNLKLSKNNINKLLIYGGEVDFIKDMYIIDAKCYRNVTSKELSTWCWQLMLYANNSDYNIKHYYVYEGISNNIYQFIVKPLKLPLPTIDE